jgi:hypothetical protein
MPSAIPFARKPDLKPYHNAVRFMTNSLGNPVPTSRRLACAGCGTEFSCSLSGPCWCNEETVRLPMPSDGSDCLCRDCLRKVAVQPSGNAS